MVSMRSSIGLGTIAPAAESAKSKLERVLPQLRERVNAVRTAMLSATPYGRRRSFGAFHTGAELAVYQHQRVRMGYRRVDGRATVRKSYIEPYGLMLHNYRWFLEPIAPCGDSGFSGSTALPVASSLCRKLVPPDAFDMKEFVHRGLVYAASDWKIEVGWIVRSTTLRRFPVAYAEFIPEGHGTVLKRGSTTWKQSP
ncbi:MAG: hypothetical protein R2848_12740 [Thermomicrobiales bacterium]